MVAHNLTQARQLRGLTQLEIAERLSKFTGTPWTAVTVAQAEGSVSGNRVRQFTANELVAMARTFDLPVLYFFLPPEDRSGLLLTPDAGHQPWEYLLMLVWGHSGNLADVAERAAPWAHVSPDLVPYDDLLGSERENWLLAGTRLRNRIMPEDIAAIAFNGMFRRHMRGSFAGKDLEKLASNLRQLADAFDAFSRYPAGAFIDPEAVRDIVAHQERARMEGDAPSVDSEQTEAEEEP